MCVDRRCDHSCLIEPTDEELAEWMDPVTWVAELARDQRSLRRLGARALAEHLFGERVRRDIVARVGAAMLDRGPSGRLGNRAGSVALAAAAADWLSADQIADVLDWPPPAQLLDHTGADHLRAVLALVAPQRRFHVVEAVAAASEFAATVVHHRSAPDTTAWPSHHADRFDHYLVTVQQLIGASHVLVVDDDGAVQFTGSTCLGDTLELVAVAARCHARLLGPLPRFGGDLAAYGESLLRRVFPTLDWRAWDWNTELVEALSAEVPGLPGADLILPENAAELAQWGESLNNCLGDRVEDIGADLVIGGLERDGHMVAAFSLMAGPSGWLIEQVAGRHNVTDTPEVQLLEAHLRKIAAVLPDDLVATTVGHRPPSYPAHLAGHLPLADAVQLELDLRSRSRVTSPPQRTRTP